MSKTKQRWRFPWTCAGMAMGAVISIVLLALYLSKVPVPTHQWYLRLDALVPVTMSYWREHAVLKDGPPYLVLVAGPLMEWMAWGILLDVVRAGALWLRKDARAI
jgi:hypothetical protein